MARTVLGVDGCPAGWVAAKYDLDARELFFIIYPNFRAILAENSSATAIAVDIPIGLAQTFAPRPCDVEARQFVGPRRSSVFPSPDRSLLVFCDAIQYAAASEFSRAKCGRGITRQAHGIFRKIAEVDNCIDSSQQHRIFEVHPEVSFRAANGALLRFSKKTKEGRQERLGILSRAFEGAATAAGLEKVRLPGAHPDDILDAAIATWTALRVENRSAQRIPEHPMLDDRGLRMEIVY